MIDDFGRQRCSPRDLLNRWIVPLESRVDYLTLQSGQKFELPFMALVVFATNIKPADWSTKRSCAAFTTRSLRRARRRGLHEDFRELLPRARRDVRAGTRRASAPRVLPPRKIALRGCQPRDLIDQALSLANYLGKPPQLDAGVIDAACDTYFVDDREDPAVYA